MSRLLLLLTVFLFWSVMADPRGSRVKRRLIFPKGAKFFCRLNVKENVLRYTPIFAFAYGFRTAYDLPTNAKTFPFQNVFRRAMYSDLEGLVKEHGHDGQACILRAVCEASKIPTVSGMVQKVLKYVFTIPKEENEGMELYSSTDNCTSAIERCPFSLLRTVSTGQYELRYNM